MEEKLQALADRVAFEYGRVAPAAWRNQTYFSYRAAECRLGNIVVPIGYLVGRIPLRGRQQRKAVVWYCFAE